MLNTPLQEVKKGDDFGAAAVNQLIGRINAIQKRIGSLNLSGVIGRKVVAFKVDRPITSATGYYEIKTFSGQFGGTLSGNFSESDVGILSEVTDAIAINLFQVNGGGSAVPSDSLLIGMFIGNADDDDANYPGWPIIAFAPGGGSLPTPEFQGMGLYAVVDQQLGADFLVSHAMESI